MNILKEKLNESKFNNNYSKNIISAENHFLKLLEVCNNSWHHSWGSYLFDGLNYHYCIDTYDKQKLLFDKIKNCNSVLEIGTYMGHSLLIMLLSNPNLEITCVDIDNKYAKPATEYLQKVFPKSKIQFIHGSSLEALPKLNKKYDFFHIDGSHKNNLITKEFQYCKNLCSSNIFKIMFDDIVDCQPLLNSIKKDFFIKEEIIPNCRWTNGYYEIIL